MTALPIVAMTLYKHGVGFFTRRAERPEGEAVSLTFAKDEMNDVLKSLTVVAAGGGQVLGVDYDTPEDKAARLTRSSIRLSDHASLRDLLRDLRGRRVTVASPSGELTGLVVGEDLPGEREGLAATLLTLFDPVERRTRTVTLGALDALTLLDERAAADLAYFLETSLTEENKRAVTIRLSTRVTDLRVSYIAASPVWRVSYRLVADATSRGGQGLLQGWGLFDNTLDEDLEQVRLTFVSGMPVSFIYDLYNPFTPSRPVIKEEGRTVAGPVEFAAAVGAGAPRMAAAMRMTRSQTLDDGAPLPPPALNMEEMQASTVIAATGQAQGEFFSYAVNSPVTVRRGRSALVPILQNRLAFTKERIYNKGKQPKHPVITARFRNDTGLTLERGPLTVIEAGEYAGDALLPFTAPGGEVFLAYAVDLGVTVREAAESTRALAAVRIKDGMVVVEEFDIQKVTYRIENRNEQAVSIILEHPRQSQYTPFETPDPVETTAEHLRYRLQVAAQDSAEFAVRQRRLTYRREEIRNQKVDQLARWLRERALDGAAFERLRGILALYDRIGEHELALKQQEAARQEIFGQQKVIQGNLGALKETGEEGQLRGRYARKLQELEDRLNELTQQDADMRRAIQALDAEIEAALKRF